MGLLRNFSFPEGDFPDRTGRNCKHMNAHVSAERSEPNGGPDVASTVPRGRALRPPCEFGSRVPGEGASPFHYSSRSCSYQTKREYSLHSVPVDGGCTGMDQDGYRKNYTDVGFWEKVENVAKVAGEEVIEKALFLWYAMRKPETPAWAKATILGALGYFIAPIDAIPDFIPVIGYVDDLGVMVMALATVAAFVDDEVREQARATMRKWFG